MLLGGVNCGFCWYFGYFRVFCAFLAFWVDWPGLPWFVGCFGFQSFAFVVVFGCLALFIPLDIWCGAAFFEVVLLELEVLFHSYLMILVLGCVWFADLRGLGCFSLGLGLGGLVVALVGASLIVWLVNYVLLFGMRVCFCYGVLVVLGGFVGLVWGIWLFRSVGFLLCIFGLVCYL